MQNYNGHGDIKKSAYLPQSSKKILQILSLEMPITQIQKDLKKGQYQ